MKAVIHIGTHKTGTTTIQSLLENNRQALKKQGVFVPTDAPHHRLITATYHPKTWESGPLFSFKGHVNHNHHARKDFLNKVFNKCISPEQQHKLWGKYRREIEKNCNKEDTVIFTSEHFCHFLENEVARVKELLDSLFEDTTVVLYLRRQPEFLVSQYHQFVLSGAAWNIFDFVNMPEDRSILAYHQIVKRWSIFGKDKIKIRIFDRKAFHENDLLSDFAATVGFDLAGLKRVENRNEAVMSSAEVEFMRSLNSHIPMQIDPHTRNPNYSKQVRKYIGNYARKNSGGSTKGYHFNRNEAKQILDKYREGNDWIAQEYLGKEHLFDDDVSMYPEEVASGHNLTPEKWGAITAHVLREMRKRQVSHWFRSLRVWLQQKIVR